MQVTTGTGTPLRVLLLARSATTGAPLREMERWCDDAATLPGIAAAVFAFSEEGIPSLRDALRTLVTANDTPIVIVPMLLPAEASFVTWIRRTVQRWKASDGRPWPDIRIAPFPGDHPLMRELLAATIRSDDSQSLDTPHVPPTDGSVVPAQKRRVLVCMVVPATPPAPRSSGAICATSRSASCSGRQATAP